MSQNVLYTEVGHGTHQGAVLSPPLSSLYMDGCWVSHGGPLDRLGATCYADDLLLLAPTRSAMGAMINGCEKYALRNNLSFSTHEGPAQSENRMSLPLW